MYKEKANKPNGSALISQNTEQKSEIMLTGLGGYRLISTVCGVLKKLLGKSTRLRLLNRLAWQTLDTSAFTYLQLCDLSCGCSFIISLFSAARIDVVSRRCLWWTSSSNPKGWPVEIPKENRVGANYKQMSTEIAEICLVMTEARSGVGMDWDNMTDRDSCRKKRQQRKWRGRGKEKKNIIRAAMKPWLVLSGRPEELQKS